ncbi:hypothetical protein C7S18_23535 (plasmid) [Ahniella affigens]|uniref:HTH IS21-type domain-containing protein n=1 Tax=Ahniella affigens TaxID=2021234 RepID=A0A2P1PZK2_9GAMM|nr:hypothetical protein C7S18_23535 [Ahniella affigens]
MLSQEESVEIEVLLKQGMGVREVARRCGVSRNTVRRVREEGSGRRYQREARVSKLAPYLDYIRDRLAAAAPDWIPASVMLREIKAQGYSGSHSILRAHMAVMRPAHLVDQVPQVGDSLRERQPMLAPSVRPSVELGHTPSQSMRISSSNQTAFQPAGEACLISARSRSRCSFESDPDEVAPS